MGKHTVDKDCSYGTDDGKEESAREEAPMAFTALSDLRAYKCS